MSTKDVIKNSVYESLAGGTGLSFMEVGIIFLLAIVVGMYVYMIYKLSAKAAFYSRDTGATIAGMPIVIAAIMVAMQSNLIVSLGMVGALSIVRFRNAVKNPLDILYLFWSISAGIICGVGLKLLAILLCVVMTILLLIISLIPNSKAASVLVIRAFDDTVDWTEVQKVLREYSRNCKEKSRSIRNGETEVIYELTTSRENEMLQSLKRFNLDQINFLAHDGEFRL
ncbi:MAG: DUF4956 domain-containing protein [Bacillota bacterium]|nr:DUF4956 domain-containing protein [Bacillota bacterium]